MYTHIYIPFFLRSCVWSRSTVLCIKWGPTLCRSDPTKRSPKGEARRHSNNLIDIWESKDLGPYQTHYPIKMGAGCQKKTWQPDAQTIREMLTNDGCKRNNILTSPRIPLQNRSYAQTMTVARRKQHATKKFKTLLWRSPSPSWAIKLLLKTHREAIHQLWSAIHSNGQR